ncbi:hypothetical protein Hanom_Chr04g00334281 [Helianthus anomalus]
MRSEERRKEHKKLVSKRREVYCVGGVVSIRLLKKMDQEERREGSRK